MRIAYGILCAALLAAPAMADELVIKTTPNAGDVQHDLNKAARSPIYDGALLVPGNRVAGPAVIETTDTTVVVHPRRTLEVDAFGNFEIHF